MILLLFIVRYFPDISDRAVEMLDDQLEKCKVNTKHESVEQLLRLTLEHRREWIEKVAPKERIEVSFNKYDCLHNPAHVSLSLL